MKYLVTATAASIFALAAPAEAQETAPPPPLKVSGSVGLVNDYRFRGVSQSDEEMAIQGGFTIAHESGLYVATWGSNLAGWGQFGGSNMELDLVAGYKLPHCLRITVGDEASCRRVAHAIGQFKGGR